MHEIGRLDGCSVGFLIVMVHRSILLYHSKSISQTVGFSSVLYDSGNIYEMVI